MGEASQSNGGASAPQTELQNSVHRLPSGSTAVRRTNPNQWLKLTLAVRTKQPLPDLSKLDGQKPGERKYLTRAELAEQYGTATDAAAAVEAFAKAHGLVITRNETASGRIGLGGTVQALSDAFGVTLFDYDHPTLGRFHARTGPIHLPPELKGVVTAVFGFNNHRILVRKSRIADDSPDAEAKPAARAWFMPTELVPLYDFPTADTSKQCIGLLEFGGGVDMTAVAAYFKTISAAAPPIAIIPIDGASTNPAADPDSTGEVMLDVDVAGAMAPGAKLAVYFSSFDEKGMVDCISAVLNDATNDPSVLSVSWGWAENEPLGTAPVLWSEAAIEACNQSFLAAANLGITICVATGDDGSEAQVKDGKAHVNFPATSPYVLAVGGTTLHVVKNAAGATHTTETVWNGGTSDGGTGGGVSDLTPVPAWQKGIVPASINPGKFAGRAIPDVAANADPATGYLTQAGTKPQIVGGTSASTPLWASLIARINANLGARCGNFNALLYSKIGPGKTLTDITSGNNDVEGLLNGQFSAKAGWDACTGWGSPGGNALQKALSSKA
ncbi:MAG TPA: S53 family peptidase [Opitutaceae bacterium]